MHAFSFINVVEQQNSVEIITRVIVAIILGFAIGLERELTNKSAGLRTHILVCLGSTIFTILSLYGFESLRAQHGIIIQNDPARIAAQIVTGIGFIGGGVVLHHGVSIYGLTTAASLWVAASIGMAVGTGSYLVAIVSTILSFIILVLVGHLEKKWLSKFTIKSNRIKVSLMCEKEHLSEVQDFLYKEFNNMLEIAVKKSKKEENLRQVSIIVDIYDKNPLKTIHEKLHNVNNIKDITLQKNTYEL